MNFVRYFVAHQDEPSPDVRATIREPLLASSGRTELNEGKTQM